ncbi:MAG: hypothetical protein FVQ85_18895 [Planctomycetes bacterium]|nr:hypothetical protein [Planctomycetota bacterium]
MIRPVPKALVLAVGIVIGFMLIAGCEEEENLSNAKPDTEPNTKRSRLIAVENAQLKEQIERQKGSQTREIERLKNLHAKETDRQKKLFDNCLREKEALEEMSKKGVENYMQDILGPLSEENVKLREEIETLKAQIK